MCFAWLQFQKTLVTTIVFDVYNLSKKWRIPIHSTIHHHLHYSCSVIIFDGHAHFRLSILTVCPSSVFVSRTSHEC